jgi:hypothetical protein
VIEIAGLPETAPTTQSFFYALAKALQAMIHGAKGRPALAHPACGVHNRPSRQFSPGEKSHGDKQPDEDIEDYESPYKRHLVQLRPR